MKYIITIIVAFLLTCSIQLSGQESESNNQKDLIRITLKGGSKLEGKLISYDPKAELVIEVAGNDIRLPSKSVKKIVMLTSSEKVRVNQFKTDRFYNRTNLGMLSNANGNGISLNYSLLYQKNKWLAAGLGVGVDNYYFQPGRNVYPLFFEIRSFLVDGNSAPYVSLKSGYGFIFNSENADQTDTKGGMFVNPTFGYRISSSGLMLDLYLGLRFQNAEYKTNNGWGKSHQEIQWNRVELGFGVSF